MSLVLSACSGSIYVCPAHLHGTKRFRWFIIMLYGSTSSALLQWLISSAARKFVCGLAETKDKRKIRRAQLNSGICLERLVAIASTRSFARGLHNSFTLGICSQDRSIEIARLADASRFQADSFRQIFCLYIVVAINGQCINWISRPSEQKCSK